MLVAAQNILDFSFFLSIDEDEARRRVCCYARKNAFLQENILSLGF